MRGWEAQRKCVRCMQGMLWFFVEINIHSCGESATRTPKVFCRPGTTFRYDVNLPLTFTFVPFSERRPQVGHRAI